jgi:hypothetical protein
MQLMFAVAIRLSFNVPVSQEMADPLGFLEIRKSMIIAHGIASGDAEIPAAQGGLDHPEMVLQNRCLVRSQALYLKDRLNMPPVGSYYERREICYIFRSSDRHLARMRLVCDFWCRF